MIVKFLNIKPGTMITRRYRNARKVRAFSVVNTLVATSLGYHHAKNGSKFVFVDMANILLFGKFTEKSNRIMKNLKPEYKQIVARAKAIFGKK